MKPINCLFILLTYTEKKLIEKRIFCFSSTKTKILQYSKKFIRSSYLLLVLVTDVSRVLPIENRNKIVSLNSIFTPFEKRFENE